MKKKIKRNRICVVGWYFFHDFYKLLFKSKLDIYIVAHRYHKILDDLKFNYTVIDNVGLEFGVYDWYIKNVWDKKSNVIFMHDDMEIKNKNTLLRIFNKCKKLKIDQSYIFGENCEGPHGRCIYMSRCFIDKIKKDYGGIWYDKENIGYIHHKQQPIGWDKKRYNLGTYNFFKMATEIGLKYNKIT